MWRELISRYEFAQLTRGEGLWAEPFDASQPIDSPSGLAPPGADGSDPALVRLGWAVQILEAAGVAPDAALGDLQFADRNGERVPIHGGDNFDGATNIVGYGVGWSTLEDIPRREDTFASRSNLTSEGYRINNGTSFLLALHFGPDGPEARTFLTYGQSEDRRAPVFVEATRRFSAKDWRPVAFKDEAIATDRNLTEKTVRG